MVSSLPKSNWDFPPADSARCMGIVCNGEIENPRDRVSKCLSVMGVDGGINHCVNMNIIPTWIVGDFDSVNPGILDKLMRSVKCIKLRRAKDETDLEVAILKALEISKTAQILIFGGLGGRLDHTMSNIFITLRYPGQVFLESERQTVFGLNDQIGKIDVDATKFQTVALYPFNGQSSGVRIDNQDAVTLDKGKIIWLPGKCRFSISIGNGELIVILSTDFLLREPIIRTLEKLAYQSLNKIIYTSEKEIVAHLKPDNGKTVFYSLKGQVISLIPLHGPAKIQTTGLKWELKLGKLDHLDRNFVSISNIALGNEFFVEVNQGELLCILNQIVDDDLLQQEI